MDLNHVLVPVAGGPNAVISSRLVTATSIALPGTLTVAFGWMVLYGVILFFAKNTATYAIYGVLSEIISILTSLYIAAFVLMTGIVVNTVLATDTDNQGSSWDTFTTERS